MLTAQIYNQYLLFDREGWKIGLVKFLGENEDVLMKY
jgi:hypothetical protein